MVASSTYLTSAFGDSQGKHDFISFQVRPADELGPIDCTGLGHLTISVPRALTCA